MKRKPSRFILLGLLAAALMVPFNTSAALAVVVISTDTGNTTPPPDDPGFNNLGSFSVGGVVYLGNGWALTAKHLDQFTGGLITTVNFPAGGGTFNILQKVPVLNPNGLGLTGESDLLLLKLDANPSLPGVTIGGTPAPIGGAIVMIGRGAEREATETFWTLTGSSPNITWTESAPPGNASGFKPSGVSGNMRWGTNLIEDDNLFDGGTGDLNHTVTLQLAGRDQIVMISDFDKAGATAHEAQVASGDSGGAVFYKNGSTWELIGLHHAQGTFEDQPPGTMVFGNVSYFSDLSVYRSNIMVAVPEPSTFALAGLAGAGLLAYAVRRHRGQQAKG